MFWIFLIAIGLAWALQSWLSFAQTREFTRLFVALRRKGRVAMGKFRGGLVAGAIVMLVLDDDDRVLEGHRLRGVSVLARFKPFDFYDDQFVGLIDPQASSPLGRSVVRAVQNLRDNYRVVMNAGTPAEPPTAVARALDKLPGFNARPRVLDTPRGTSGPRRKVVVRRAATGT